MHLSQIHAYRDVPDYYPIAYAESYLASQLTLLKRQSKLPTLRQGRDENLRRRSSVSRRNDATLSLSPHPPARQRYLGLRYRLLRAYPGKCLARGI